ncbi:MAG: hypothetical protein Q4Q53_03855 [Methanocorpusculum sp.]|nr:hypothetical protein [Methanocorpusculum sp.]
MNYLPFAAAAITILLILSAGCIGTQTTDIVIGNETVGKIYITPNTDKLLSNSSITEKFDMKVDLFGFEFSKEGITQSEADSITDSLSKGINDTNFFTDLGFEMSESSKSGADSFEEIVDQIVNMPISAKDSTRVWDAVNFSTVWKNFEELAQKMTNLFN